MLFELPDVLRVLREGAFWDIYYEHCSYFTPGSLARLFRPTGFEVLDLELDYDDQYILVEALPGGEAREPSLPIEEPPEAVAGAVAEFTRNLATVEARWRTELGSVRSRGGTTAVWGSGSKGVSFLTTLGLGEEVSAVVDINPYKQGKYMAGTGHEIVAPDALRARAAGPRGRHEPGLPRRDPARARRARRRCATRSSLTGNHLRRPA